MSDLQANPLAYLQDEICGWVRESPLNHLHLIDDQPIFDVPLIGVADGDDPLFDQYKSMIGSFYVTPREAIAYAGEAAPETQNPSMESISVLAWVLPITQATRRTNRSQHEVPSREWAHTRFYGEQFVDSLRRHMVEVLQRQGYLAIAPVVSPLFKQIQLLSTWSERHVMYAAGLGTFSLNDGFITSRGIAMRCGSLVTNLPLPISPRTYASHVANCLHYRDGSCGKCIERCPVGAISRAGHDKQKCWAYVYQTLGSLREPYGVPITGCGLCQTGVPCESGIPKTAD